MQLIDLRRGHVRLVAAFAAATSCLFALAGAPAASAAGLNIPSRTVVSVSSAGTVPSDNGAILPGDSANVSASVRPGLLVSTAGSVAFEDTTTNTPLGSAQMPSSCFLHFGPCEVSVSVDSSSLVEGLNTIGASFSGSRLLAPSSGRAELDLESQTTSDGQTTTDCAFACATGEVTSPDETTAASISGAAGSSAEVVESFTTDQLPCSTAGGGDVLVFEATGFESNKTILFQAFGTSADTLERLYSGGEHVCYESPSRFVVAPDSPPLQLDPNTGLYFGLLPQCQPSRSERVGEGINWNGTSLNPPCVDFASFTSGWDTLDSYTQQFEVKASDPRASN